MHARFHTGGVSSTDVMQYYDTDTRQHHSGSLQARAAGHVGTDLLLDSTTDRVAKLAIFKNLAA